MERMAGQCYFDLNNILTAMSEVPTEPQQQQANGIVPHTGQDTSEGSQTKKRMLLEFANSQRDRFIKRSCYLTGAEMKKRKLGCSM